MNVVGAKNILEYFHMMVGIAIHAGLWVVYIFTCIQRDRPVCAMHVLIWNSEKQCGGLWVRLSDLIDYEWHWLLYTYPVLLLTKFGAFKHLSDSVPLSFQSVVGLSKLVNLPYLVHEPIKDLNRIFFLPLFSSRHLLSFLLNLLSFFIWTVPGVYASEE